MRAGRARGEGSSPRAPHEAMDLPPEPCWIKCLVGVARIHRHSIAVAPVVCSVAFPRCLVGSCVPGVSGGYGPWVIAGIRPHGWGNYGQRWHGNMARRSTREYIVISRGEWRSDHTLREGDICPRSGANRSWGKPMLQNTAPNSTAAKPHTPKESISKNGYEASRHSVISSRRAKPTVMTNLLPIMPKCWAPNKQTRTRLRQPPSRHRNNTMKSKRSATREQSSGRLAPTEHRTTRSSTVGPTWENAIASKHAANYDGW